MSEPDHSAIVELLASTDTETAEAVAAIQRFGLRSLLGGKCIGIDDIAGQAELSVDEVRAGIDSLIDAGRIETDGDTIIGVGGLTLTPTRHGLELPDAEMHTWCALDAVGIPAAFDLSARATTSCPYCQAKIVVRVAEGRVAGPIGVVLFCPTGPCVDVRADFCATANLFCNPGHLAAWRHRHDEPDGTVFDLDASAALGRQMWAPHIADS